MSEQLPTEELKESAGALAFQFFCAAVFLGMIGLVFYNAMLRYVFRSSFAPSEEWARILFMYITFFGAIEAFYRGRHISVDMVTSLLSGVARKSVDIAAQALSLAALGLLTIGGVSLVRQTMDTYTVATGLNMVFVNGTLPVMAGAVFLMYVRTLIRTIRTPASEFKRQVKEIE